MWEFLKDNSIADNELWRIMLFFVIILGSFIAGKVLQFIFSKASGNRSAKGHDVVAAGLQAIADSIVFIALTFGFKIATAFIVVSEAIQGYLQGATASLITAAIGYGLYRAVDMIDAWLTDAADDTENKMDDMIVPMVRKSLRVTIVFFTLLQIATVLSDQPLTSLLAGLGIGGLAFALASQDTLKNLFGSLVLFADKPFILGDRVIIDDFDGPVEEVGFRSTRIRTLEGHLVTIPNGELANKSIRNVGKRPNVRRIMNIGVTYDTSPEKLERAVEIVREVLNSHAGLDEEFPPRVYFQDFGAYSLNIFAIYWYHPPDWWAYMEESERLNFEILKRFEAEGIEFAFPTQTLFLAGDPGRPLKVNE